MNRDTAIAAGAVLATLAGFFAVDSLQLGPNRGAPDVSRPSGTANRLANTASPYLRQHAHNPVDWYPWSDEAFAKARRENKPVFLSVGYSTCHWCHVMERESFADKGIAELLNRSFVSIKVDRERRPDIDEMYMLATEIITKTGGWPNSVFLTPDRRPFFAGGYFPKDAFAELLKDVTKGWTGGKRAEFEATAQQLSASITRLMNIRTKAVPITKDAVTGAAQKILKNFDGFNGGFGTAPKFPHETVLEFLLRLGEKDGFDTARAAALQTLDYMLAGGIHDQLGGGFHRYAIDNEWLVPHFEKMLYNQALIARLLITAHRLTGKQHYADAAKRTLDFVLRDMRAPNGAFYSGLDAESLEPGGRKKEGAFYIWTLEDLEKALGRQDAMFAAQMFGATANGNFDGSNVLHLPEKNIKEPARFKRVREKLLQARSARPAPFRDEKIIAAWNGAMIEAFALAAGPLNRPDFLDAAEKAAMFTQERIGGKTGDLARIHFEGQPDIPGQLEDFAALGNAYLTLYDITGDAGWGIRALTLAKKINKKFKDSVTGDYFMTAGINGFARSKQKADGALPAGNAMALRLFNRLARRTGLPAPKQDSASLQASLSGIALAAPAAHAAALTALDELERGDTGPIQYLGGGKVRVRLSGSGNIRTFRLEIAPGWHINAHTPLEEFLIATKTTIVGENAPEIEVIYPKPVTRTLGFNKNPLALYEGNVEIRITARSPLPKSTRLGLIAQACSDQICLEPETLTFVP